jgi:hypothetical protein
MFSKAIVIVIALALVAGPAAAKNPAQDPSPVSQPLALSSDRDVGDYCHVGEVNGVYAYSGWFIGDEEYAMYSDPGDCEDCEGGWKPNSVTLWFVMPGVDTLYMQPIIRDIDWSDTSCPVPGATIHVEGTYQVVVPHSGTFIVNLPLSDCPTVADPFFACVNFPDWCLDPGDTCMYVVVSDTILPCRSYNNWGSGWEDLYDWSFVGNVSISADLECQAPDTIEYCTFTQGFYGNYGGHFNGVGTLDLIDGLISDANSLYIGVCSQSVRFAEGSEWCIVEKLPAGGKPSALPDSLNGATMDTTDCDTDPPLPEKNGRFRNVLLGQTITLGLNMMLNEDLEDFELCYEILTQAANCGPDTICGNEDDYPDPSQSVESFFIPMAVLETLDDLGLDETVHGLWLLANRALAGSDHGDATLSEINQAVSAINEAFDGCRFFVGCEEYVPPAPSHATIKFIEAQESQGAQHDSPMSKEGVPTRFSLLPSSPNPVRDVALIQYSLPEASNVAIRVYNLRGQAVAVLENGIVGPGRHGVQWSLRDNPDVSSGVYFYRLEARGVATGESFTGTGKLIVVR